MIAAANMAPAVAPCAACRDDRVVLRRVVRGHPIAPCRQCALAWPHATTIDAADFYDEAYFQQACYFGLPMPRLPGAGLLHRISLPFTLFDIMRPSARKPAVPVATT